MDYIGSNKAAWEEAFERRFENWGDDDYIRLISATRYFQRKGEH